MTVYSIDFNAENHKSLQVLTFAFSSNTNNDDDNQSCCGASTDNDDDFHTVRVRSVGILVAIDYSWHTVQTYSTT